MTESKDKGMSVKSTRSRSTSASAEFTCSFFVYKKNIMYNTYHCGAEREKERGHITAQKATEKRLQMGRRRVGGAGHEVPHWEGSACLCKTERGSRSCQKARNRRKCHRRATELPGARAQASRGFALYENSQRQKVLDISCRYIQVKGVEE